MMKDILKNIIIEFHRDFEFSTYDRDLKININPDIHKAVTIYGPRRSGKTYFLFNFIEKYYKKEKIENTIYINFEDNRLIDLKAKELDLITDAYKELYPDKTPVYFLDEIQNIDNWSKWIRKLVDKKQKVFITGSNSKLLSKEIATELRGRTLSYMLLPFSLNEFLNYHKLLLKSNDYYDISKKQQFYHLFDQYLNKGGFPELLNLNEAESKIILQEYINSIVYKDIIDRYRIKNSFTIKFLINYFLENYSTLFSVNKIYNFLKSQNYETGKSNLYDYISHFEDSVFLFKSQKYEKSLKKRSAYIKKYYLSDIGYSVLSRYGVNTGRVFENIIYNELLRSGLEINYLSNGFECDIILHSERSVYPIQVCYLLKADYNTFNREINSLKSAMQYLNKRKGFIITYGESDIINDSGLQIIILSAFDFHLKFKDYLE